MVWKSRCALVCGPRRLHKNEKYLLYKKYHAEKHIYRDATNSIGVILRTLSSDGQQPKKCSSAQHRIFSPDRVISRGKCCVKLTCLTTVKWRMTSLLQDTLSHDQDHESVQVHMFKHCADGSTLRVLMNETSIWLLAGCVAILWLWFHTLPRTRRSLQNAWPSTAHHIMPSMADAVSTPDE